MDGEISETKKTFELVTYQKSEEKEENFSKEIIDLSQCISITEPKNDFNIQYRYDSK